jgi:serine phosphatase RsbU (regulator of sigma subunit)
MTDALLNVTDRLGRRVVHIDKPLFTIGRSQECDLRVSGGEVSRDHAEIAREGDHYLLRDRGSRYGTFVNGELLKERVLEHGDRVRLGRNPAVDLVFLSEQDVSAIQRSLLGALKQTAALLEGLQALGAGHLLNDVLALVLDAAVEVSDADRGFIILTTSDGRLEFTLGRGRGHVALSGRTFETSHKIPEEVFATGETRIVSNLIEGDTADTHEATIQLGIRQVLCVPLRLTRFLDRPGASPVPTRIGVLYLDSRASGTLLSPHTRVGIETLAVEAAVAIENARLYRETLEKARIDQELRIAAEMQQALRPVPHHVGRRFEILGASAPSRSIGGDFFDYVELAQDTFGFALGDVAGKGPPAAVLAAALQGMFAAYASDDRGPGETLTRVNVTLERHFVENRFATMVYGVLLSDGRLMYSNAGHNPPMLFSQGTLRRLEEGGVPLGIFQDARFQEETIQLETGDLLVAFSDGVSEAPNSKGEPFGDNRIASCISANLQLETSLLLDRLLATVREFSEGAEQDDDVTVLILRYRDP